MTSSLIRVLTFFLPSQAFYATKANIVLTPPLLPYRHTILNVNLKCYEKNSKFCKTCLRMRSFSFSLSLTFRSN